VVCGERRRECRGEKYEEAGMVYGSVSGGQVLGKESGSIG
jgi:hypothetical protein